MHRLGVFVFLVHFALMPFLHASGPTPADSILKIWCVGDSITQGGIRDRKEYTYRLPLQRLLQERGIAADFIGSRTDGLHPDAVWPDVSPNTPFDPAHDGYYGWRTADVINEIVPKFGRLGGIPDIVLIHLGSNDQRHGDYDNTIGRPLRDFIGFLRRHNPGVVVLLGHLNFNDNPMADAIRTVVESVAADLSTPASPVVTVPHYLGWHEDPEHAQTDTFDWAHPNPRGQEKMAAAWLAAMEPLLKNRP